MRRREKKVRQGYSPPEEGQFAKNRRQLTTGMRTEILALYDQALRECRKALFINPNLAADTSHFSDVKSKKAQFLAWIEKEFGPDATPEGAGDAK